MSARVTVLGLGAMGARIASNLAAAGHSVTVWNRTAGAATALAGRTRLAIAPSAAEAVAEADVAIVVVTDDEASRAVWIDAGALDALPPDSLAVDASTLSPVAVGRLTHEAAHRGRRFVVAPVVGSRPQADAAALVVLAGGSVADVRCARAVLAATASTVHHVGTPADAAALKLAINGLLACQVASFSEAVGLLIRSGLAEADVLELLSGLAVTPPAIQRALALIGRRAFDPNFPIRLVAKDTRYLAALADALDSPAPLAAATAEIYARADDEPELAARDITAIATRYGL